MGVSMLLPPLLWPLLLMLWPLLMLLLLLLELLPLRFETAEEDGPLALGGGG